MRRLGAFLAWIAPLVLALAVLLSVLYGCRASMSAADGLSSDGIIVQLEPGVSPPPGAVALYGLPHTYAIPNLTAKSAQDAATEYQKRPGVRYAEPNVVVSLDLPVRTEPDGLILATVNDPYASLQYSLDTMRVYDAWNVSRGDGVVIAILDSGIDFSHPDLTGKVVSRGRDFVSNDNDASDDNGHGTHVAGIAAAATNNGAGIAGVGYNARILPVKVLGANGNGTYAQIISGIYYALDNGARVINLSLGANTPTTLLEQAIETAWARGTVLTCAAGNSGSPSPSYPAAYPGCMAVGATDQGDRRAAYSNFGDLWVDVAAPGSGVFGTVTGNQYQAWNGTSMAAPNAAGVAALVWAARPAWNNAQVRAALEGGADALPGQQLGRGRLNAARAVSGSSPAPQPQPIPQPTQFPDQGDYASQVETLINQARGQYGLPALRIDGRLRAAGAAHNRWMSQHNCFAHTCPGEPDVMQRMRHAGYPVISGGENIGKGYLNPQHMMDGWMNSGGHRAAILNTYWPDIGCAYLQGPSGQGWDRFWSCEFAKGGAASPLPATATPRPQPTVIVPPTRQAPPTPWWNPTPTALPWPAPPTPRPFPTATRAHDGRTAYVSIGAPSAAWQAAAAICASGWQGASCQDAPHGADYLVVVRVRGDAAPLARQWMDKLCGGYVGVRCE